MDKALTTWIAGLMRENSAALGFIPLPTIEQRYIAFDRYIIQYDERGNKVGYLLHGALIYNQPLIVSQACIIYDQRLRGYGELVVKELIRRAFVIGSTGIKLRCASDLTAVDFWQRQGFELRCVVPGGKARDRMICEFVLPLKTRPSILDLL